MSEKFTSEMLSAVPKDAPTHSRRRLLELGWIGSAALLLPAALRAAAPSQNSTGAIALTNPALTIRKPAELGKGRMSTSGALRALLVKPDAAEEEPATGTSLYADLIESRSDYSMVYSGSASAKFGYSGGTASASASASRDYKTSSRSVEFYLLMYKSRVYPTVRASE